MKGSPGTGKRPAQPARESPDRELRLWSTHRQESVFFQREAQVNFWTVLGGLAVASLLTQLAPLLGEIKADRWYLILFAFTSILILSLSWVQTAWGSLVMKWPVSIFGTVIVIFQMLFQSIQCLLITNPSGWLAATAGLIFFALLLQFYFERSGAWKVFPARFIKRFKFTNAMYVFFLLLCLAGAFQLDRFPSPVAEAIWGFVVLLLAIAALYMQHSGMQQEKRELDIP